MVGSLSAFGAKRTCTIVRDYVWPPDGGAARLKIATVISTYDQSLVECLFLAWPYLRSVRQYNSVGKYLIEARCYLASICRGWVSVLGNGALQFGARFVVCRHLLCLCIILRRRDAFARWGEFAIEPRELP
jgi:hypothetical protein